MSPSVTATVREIETEAEYRGAVHERTVTLSMDGQRVVAFENGRVLGAEDVGATLELVLHVGLAGALRTSDEGGAACCRRGLRRDERQDSRWAGTICADVVDDDLTDQWFGGSYARVVEADVGSRTVVATANDELDRALESRSVEVGDRFQARAWRIGIVGRLDDT